MLTTSQLIQQAASSFWPLLLVLIGWYSAAAAIRAGGLFGLRVFQRHRTLKRLEPLSHLPGGETSGGTQIQPILDMHSYLHQMQGVVGDSMLVSQQATLWKIGLLGLEALLFLGLAILTTAGTWELIHKFRDFWWVHLLGIFFVMCFILRARRLLLLFPLTFMAWVSWEIFSFITSFERTLEATSTLATLKVAERKADSVVLDLIFPNKTVQRLALKGQEKLYFEGRVYRVSADVLLFGGKNLASIDRLFSDSIPPNQAISLIEPESIPPTYRWQDVEQGMRNELRKKFSYMIWKEFFSLKKKDETTTSRLIQTKLLEASICTPLKEGSEFEIKLRHVGGLECHAKIPPTSAPASPPPSR